MYIASNSGLMGLKFLNGSLLYYFHSLVLHSHSSNDVIVLIVTSSQPSDSSCDCSCDCSSDDNGVIIALATLLAIAVIGLVISIVINVFFVVQRKQSRCVVTSIHSM